MKKFQSRTIHIGNQGENLVSSMLSKYCIVRGVGQGEDTGLDIYCEVVDDQTLNLSLHFFCQIKTSGENTSISIIEKDLEYWAQQPAPVFLLEVKYKDDKKIHEEGEVWIYDIPWKLVQNDALNKSSVRLTRDVDDKFKLSDVSNNKDNMTVYDFIYHHLPSSYGLWNMRRYGVAMINPEIKGDAQFYTKGIAKLYLEEIKKTLSLTLSILKNEGVDLKGPSYE